MKNKPFPIIPTGQLQCGRVQTKNADAKTIKHMGGCEITGEKPLPLVLDSLTDQIAQGETTPSMERLEKWSSQVSAEFKPEAALESLIGLPTGQSNEGWIGPKRLA